MSTDLTGTVALITGATSGIGKAIAFALAGRGAHVLVGGRNAARGEAVVTSLRASGAKADFIDVDLGSSDSARELARRATELAGGHVDILVNNAAIFPMGPTPSMAEDDIDAVNPGPTRTEGTAVLGEAIDESAALAPARRPASPDEIAAAITYLASDDASFVHGAILAVDGGRTAA
jgi:NAD(P)-dependent dehydrogenase (short-subunit alcohol dehydrogenase family)